MPADSHDSQPAASQHMRPTHAPHAAGMGKEPFCRCGFGTAQRVWGVNAPGHLDMTAAVADGEGGARGRGR
eukprot:366072-Chlamydomonas_euryale.AAC.17